MGRYLGAKCRICRRIGTKLFLKGQRCYTDKCAFSRRPYAPGQHGRIRSKLSNYGLQLKEKQKVKRMYGVLERQFRRYFKAAQRKKGVTGTILLQFLERRLDNVVYQAGFATSRNQARQIVRHNWVYVNGKRVNIPSYLVKAGDEITFKNDDKVKKNLSDYKEISKKRQIPLWLMVDEDAYKITVVRLPEREDMPADVKEQMIVELYSK